MVVFRCVARLKWALVLAGMLAAGCAPAGGGRGGQGAAPGAASAAVPAMAAPASGQASTQAPAPAPAPGPARDTITLAVVGDIMLARGVGSAIARHGTAYPFAATAGRLRAADYTFANLESPLGVRGTPIPKKGIWFRARPEAVEGLRFAGIDGVTVANNHILDYDVDNFLETLSILRKNGLGIAGGGEDLAAARRPLVAEVYGVKVAFLGYSQFADIFWDWNDQRPFAATATRPGVAPIREDALAEDIARARKDADVVAVAYHWGEEYVNAPGEEQKRLARRTIDLGADLVLGFHPHAVQGVERYKGGLIAYSLGNFVMDQKRPVTMESMILEVRLSKNGVEGYQVVPVMITDAQPRVLDGEAARQLMDKIERISAGLGPQPGPAQGGP